MLLNPTTASGEALKTVNDHSATKNFKFYCGWFCPFAQRVWIALEEKGVDYQYIESNPYEKTGHLMKISPNGLVPAIEHNDWSMHESLIILEYLEAQFPSRPLLPKDPKRMANCRLAAESISKNMIRLFYELIMSQDHLETQKIKEELNKFFVKLKDEMHPVGPFFDGAEFGWVDVIAGPWIVRAELLFKEYKYYSLPSGNIKRWAQNLSEHPSVLATLSTEESYIKIYQRFKKLK